MYTSIEKIIYMAIWQICERIKDICPYRKFKQVKREKILKIILKFIAKEKTIM